MNIKKKILIVEAGSHYQVVGQLYELFKSKFDITFYLIKQKKNTINQDFLNNSQIKCYLARLKGVLIFLSILRVKRRFDLINISTGPEGSHITDKISILFFYLLCSFAGPKIILTIRNISPYLQANSGFFSYLRNRAIQKIYGITFETQSMKQIFIDQNVAPTAKLGVIYFRFSDVNRYPSMFDQPSLKRPRVTVGLLGSVEGQRRNYDVLFESLVALPVHFREQIEIVVLGRAVGVEATSILDRLRICVRVIQIDHVLNEEEFALNGVACTVLLAPLRTDKGYGALKGTGAVADAIYLRRPLILPSTVDAQQEFQNFCHYYTSAADLTKLLQRMCDVGISLKPNTFIKYKTTNVLAQLSNDLKLPSVLYKTRL
jgi:hypothetical protein